MLAEIGKFDKKLIVSKLQKEINLQHPDRQMFHLTVQKRLASDIHLRILGGSLSKLNCLSN